MGSMAEYAENKVLEHLVGKNSFTMPSGPYLGLFTVAPTDTPGSGTECSAGNYARISVPGTSWGTAASGAISNSVAIEFAECAGANWGTINGFVLFDAITGGNRLLWGTPDTPKNIDVGDTAKFAIGELNITLD